MQIKNLVLAITSLQIIIVVIIIILVYKIVAKHTKSDYIQSRIHIKNLQNNYFRWLAYGFVFNLIYLLLNLNNHVKLIYISDLRPPTILLDISCSLCFLIGAISWLFKIIRISNVNNVIHSYHVKVNLIKNILIGILVLLAIYIFQSNLQLISDKVFSEFTVSYYVFNFCSSAFLSVFFFTEKRFIPKWQLLPWGFLIWTLLQLLPMVGPYFFLTDEGITVAGFGFSTIAKIFIAVGLLIYYDSIEKGRLKFLEQRKSELEILQNIINETSKAINLNQLCQIILDNLTKPKSIFKFDYAIIYKIDYLKQKIVYQNSVCLNESIKDFGNWVNKEGVDLTQFDILAYTVKVQDIVHAVGNIVDGKEENLNSKTSKFDPAIFFKSDLHNIERFFIPAIKSFNSWRYQNEMDLPHYRVVAVIEVGDFNSIRKNLKSQLYAKNEQLSIYINNSAHTFRNIVETEIRHNSRQVLLMADKLSGDDPSMYLQLILEKTCKLINAKFGCISIYSYNHDAVLFDPLENSVFYKISKDKLPQFLFENRKLVDDKITSYSILQKNEYKVESVVCIPIKYAGVKIGEARVFGKTKSFYNEDSNFILKRIFEEVGSVYVEKKFHTAVSRIALPENKVSESEGIIESAMGILQEYFYCDYISVWLTVSEGTETGYKQSYMSPAMKGKCLNKKDSIIKGIIRNVDFMPIDLTTKIQTDSNKPFWKYADENFLKSLIYVPLIIDKKEYGFINIYSKRKLDSLFDDDIKLLKLIANRYALAILTSKMIGSFSKITQNLVNTDLNLVLKQITNIANEILSSDPVILYRFNDEKMIAYNKTIYSGSIESPDKIYNAKKGNFIDLIINEDSDKYYIDENELPESYKERLKDSFWYTEKIESVAAIHLRHENKLIGLMCFNYREKQEFPNESSKRLIKTFSSLATTALINADQISVIQTQKQQLEAKAEKIQFDHDRTIKKMQDMLPVANASSLAQIVRAVNHDIRNHLHKVNQNLHDIKLDSVSYIRTSSLRNLLNKNIETLESDINNSTNLIGLFEPDSFKVSNEDIFNIFCDVKDLFSNESKKDKGGISVSLRKVDQELNTLLRCSKAEMSMILYNLISNAKNAIIEKWSKSGRLGDGPVGSIEIELGFLESERRYFLKVKDDGVGIDNYTKQEIYSPGYTTRKEGLGIGLYFIKETVEKYYGGVIDCKSYVNIGTTFELKFKQRK